MKRFLIILSCIISITPLFAARQTEGIVCGSVQDASGAPLGFATVYISKADNTIVTGAASDQNGHFKLKAATGKYTLTASLIGYKDAKFDIQLGTGTLEMEPIVLEEDSQLLEGAMVQVVLPKTQVKGDAMRTNVDGTVLEKAGSAADALKRVPTLEATDEGAISVMGRGDAEVYINGRKVQDKNELTRLRSDQIQYVEVIQNPGARYSASTKAVVRIRLKKAKGEGISFQNVAGGIYRYGYTGTNNLDVNYRFDGFDVTASFWAGHYGHAKSFQENDMFFYIDQNVLEGITKQESKNVWNGWSPQIQINYMANANHSMGAYYKYDRHASGEFTSKFSMDCYENKIFTERAESDITQGERFKKHIFNAYYNGRVGKLGIDLNVDGLFDDTQAPGKTIETTLVSGEEPSTRNIESNTISGNRFWASKLIFSYPVLGGNLSAGGEYSHNKRTDAYTNFASETLPVKATDTKINESSASAFVEFGRPVGRVFVQLGLRYEHLSNNYYNFGKRQDEVCRDYGDWFPTAAVAFPVSDDIQLSLSYRRDIQRPSYSELTSSTIYINRYSYQSGNPYLKPTYTHSLVFNGVYKKFNLTVDFARIKDVATLTTEAFPGSEDPMVCLIRPLNSKEPYNRLALIPSFSPTIGCWHPSWIAYVAFQNYKTPCADGPIKTLDRPVADLRWNNDIALSSGLRFTANASWTSKGDYDNFRLNKTRLNTELGVQYDIDLRKMGSLTIDARCYDIFNTFKTHATIFGPRELNSRDPARRTFSIDLTWKFNEARSKYRGSGAGQKQKARM